MVLLPSSTRKQAGWRVGSGLVSDIPSCILRKFLGFPSVPAAKYVRGMYAARVIGRIPEEIDDDIKSRGMTYRPRDETGE
jgi:hypothetical protein